MTLNFSVDEFKEMAEALERWKAITGHTISTEDFINYLICCYNHKNEQREKETIAKFGDNYQN